MLGDSLWWIIVSLLVIILVHYFYVFFRDSLTEPKIKDFITDSYTSYKELSEPLNKSNIKSDSIDMKNELQDFFSELANTSDNLNNQL